MGIFNFLRPKRTATQIAKEVTDTYLKAKVTRRKHDEALVQTTRTYCDGSDRQAIELAQYADFCLGALILLVVRKELYDGAPMLDMMGPGRASDEMDRLMQGAAQHCECAQTLCSLKRQQKNAPPGWGSKTWSPEEWPKVFSNTNYPQQNQPSQSNCFTCASPMEYRGHMVNSSWFACKNCRTIWYKSDK